MKAGAPQLPSQTSAGGGAALSPALPRLLDKRLTRVAELEDAAAEWDRLAAVEVPPGPAHGARARMARDTADGFEASPSPEVVHREHRMALRKMRTHRTAQLPPLLEGPSLDFGPTRLGRSIVDPELVRTLDAYAQSIRAVEEAPPSERRALRIIRRERKQAAIAAMAQLRDTLLETGLPEADARALAERVLITPSASSFGLSEAQLRQALTDFFRLSPGKGASILHHLISTKPRASAKADLGRIDLGENPSVRTVFHELGHLVEREDPNRLRACKDWLEFRAEGPPRPLSTFPNVRRRARPDSERAYPGPFITPYVGRVYANATEVLSMGAERFATPETMVELFVKDREHFFLVLGLLRA